MNIIFLDIDGVLNHELFYRERYKRDLFTFAHWSNWIIYKTKYVLNGFKYKSESLLNYKTPKGYGTLEYKFKRFRYETSQETIKLLNELCKNSNCKIVISATIRKDFTPEEWTLVFKRLGFENIEVIGTTDHDSENRIRGIEIKKWLDYNCADKNHVNYVILDDDSDMLQEQMSHLFIIDGFCGLTHTICYRIGRYFEGKYQIKNNN